MKLSITIVLAALALANAGSLDLKAEAKKQPTAGDVEDAWQQLVSPLSCDKECRSICCKSGGGDACVTACGCPAGSCPKAVVKQANGCEKECRSICCKSGGGDACVTACGCPAGSCPKKAAPLDWVKDAACNIESGLKCAKAVAPCIKTCKGGVKACAECLGADFPACCACIKKAIPKLPVQCPAGSPFKASNGCEKECRSICCKSGGGDACVTACGCPAGSCPKKANFERLLASWNQVVKDTDGGCRKPGACGVAYQGCCYGAGKSGDACTCKLTDGSGEVGTNCEGTDKAGACGIAYTACCIGYKAKGDACTCDVEKP